MKKLNILVTGTSGFIGRAFLSRLNADKFNIFGLSRTPPSDSSPFKQFFTQDIAKPFTIDQEFDFVFHLAACNFTHVQGAATSEFDLANVEGTRNLIKAVKAHKFIFMSTTRVYRQDGAPLTEESPLLPVGLYQESKLKAEAVLNGIPNQSIILRSTNVAGPGQPDKALVPVLFRNAFQGEPLTIITSSEARLQLLATRDLIDCFLKIIEKDLQGGIYNIAPKERISMREVAEGIIALTNSKSPVTYKSHEPVPFSPLLSDKLEKSLGWEAKTSAEELLQSCANYYRTVYAS
jgi:nucleoside-diphosphate-sugar epimerase